MDNTAPPTKLPPAYLLALTAAGGGLLCFIVATVLADDYQRMLQLLSASLCCAGLGEIFNHPRQLRLEPGTAQTAGSYHRRRNPCALGNLLLITSLLLFFMALAAIAPKR